MKSEDYFVVVLVVFSVLFVLLIGAVVSDNDESYKSYSECERYGSNEKFVQDCDVEFR